MCVWLLMVVVVAKENNQQHLNILHSQCYLIANFYPDCLGVMLTSLLVFGGVGDFQGDCCIQDGLGYCVDRFHYQNCNLFSLAC